MLGENAYLSRGGSTVRRETWKPQQVLNYSRTTRLPKASDAQGMRRQQQRQLGCASDQSDHTQELNADELSTRQA